MTDTTNITPIEAGRFETLRQAALDNRLMLVGCTRVDNGEHVAVLVVSNRTPQEIAAGHPHVLSPVGTISGANCMETEIVPPRHVTRAVRSVQDFETKINFLLEELSKNFTTDTAMLLVHELDLAGTLGVIERETAQSLCKVILQQLRSRLKSGEVTKSVQCMNCDTCPGLNQCPDWMRNARDAVDVDPAGVNDSTKQFVADALEKIQRQIRNTTKGD